MIIVQTPLRVSFLGGGTDFPSFYCNEGGCVLSSTIDKFIFITVKRRFDSKLRLGYTQAEMVDSVEELQHELIREALRKTGIWEGIEITTMGDIPSAGTGLGSSSTVTVGSLQALYTLLGEIVTAEQLARQACEIEIDILNKPIGVQDQFIVAYGGLRLLEFHTDGQVSVRRINLAADTFRRLNENLMLFFTGVTRQSGSILAEQQENIPQRLKTLRALRDMAYVACQELENGHPDALGELLHEGWELKKCLASQVSNRAIDTIYEIARQAGAVGGKITGAGGGGFLLLYCPHEKQDAVRTALRGLQELPFKLEHDGSKVIFNYRR